MKPINVIPFLSMLILVSCIPIRVVPKYNPDLYNGYKTIQAYQKKETIGHTDVEQRKKDVFACGVKNYREGSLDLSVLYPGMTVEQVIDRRLRFYDCIEKKGYTIIDSSSCTYKGKPRGVCN